MHRSRCPTVTQAVAIWLMLAAVLASSVPTAEARRRKRRRRKKAKVTRPQPGSSGLARVGSPKVVVVRRKNVSAFRLASAAFRRELSYPSAEVVLDPSTPVAEQLEDIADAKPKLILALGPGAAAALAKGAAGVPVVFGYVGRRPLTAVRQGGWLRQDAEARRVLRWTVRLTGRVRRAAVVVRDGKSARAKAFRTACRRLGVQPVVIVAASAADVVRRVVAALGRRPDVLWLGHDVTLYPPAVLKALRRLQAQFRLPVVGLTRHHVRQGLVLAVDASPTQVARAARRLIKRRVAQWLLKPRFRARGSKQAAPASRLFDEPVPADRVSVSTRTARSLGLDPQPALQAGARKVGP